MAFPVTFESRIVETLQGDSQWIVDVLRTHIATGLEREGAPRVISEGNQISFQGKFLKFFDWHWGPLRAVSSGKITINHENDQLRLTYSIRFGGVMPLVLIACFFILATAMFIQWHTPFDIAIRVYGLWGCSVVVTYLVPVSLFRNFINRLFTEFINLATLTGGRPGVKVG